MKVGDIYYLSDTSGTDFGSGGIVEILKTEGVFVLVRHLKENKNQYTYKSYLKHTNTKHIRNYKK